MFSYIVKEIFLQYPKIVSKTKSICVIKLNFIKFLIYKQLIGKFNSIKNAKRNIKL